MFDSTVVFLLETVMVQRGLELLSQLILITDTHVAEGAAVPWAQDRGGDRYRVVARDLQVFFVFYLVL